MVSVTAVKIQFNSPNSVLRSFWRPGILSISDSSIISFRRERLQNLQREDTMKAESQTKLHRLDRHKTKEDNLKKIYDRKRKKETEPRTEGAHLNK